MHCICFLNTHQSVCVFLDIYSCSSLLWRKLHRTKNRELKTKKLSISTLMSGNFCVLVHIATLTCIGFKAINSEYKDQEKLLAGRSLSCERISAHDPIELKIANRICIKKNMC